MFFSIGHDNQLLVKCYKSRVNIKGLSHVNVLYRFIFQALCLVTNCHFYVIFNVKKFLWHYLVTLSNSLKEYVYGIFINCSS